jgi:uncharacterized damage-inducible protein DinB
MDKSLDRLFVEFSIAKLGQLTRRIVDCLGRLTEDQIWARGSEHENSVGNLVLHLCGNVRQWLISGVGGAPDVRDRDREFAARGGVSSAELARRLQATVSEAGAVIDGLTAARLCETVRIQSYDNSVLDAVYHVVEHFSQHTGQIIFATKLATGEDLGYHRHLSKKTHSESTP